MKKTLTKEQIRLVGTAIVLAIAVLIYKLLMYGHLEQTSALFIGIPTVLAIGFSLLPPAKSVTGMLLKGTMIALMLSGIILSEGLICIGMATPLFALVAVIIGLVIDRSKKKKKARLLSIMFFAPMMIEGVVPGLEFNRHETVQSTQVLEIEAQEMKSKLSTQLKLDKAKPAFLNFGFPNADVVQGEGLSLGDTRCIHFYGGEGQPGDLCFEIVEVKESLVSFKMIKDSSHIAHWLRWKKSTVQWEALPDGKVKVVWTLDYERKLDPAWYFAPFERYGVSLAADYLIESYFGS